MIINTGNRTDIPAFFSPWFYNRVKEGFVMARSPYNSSLVYRYELDPRVVDIICFCTKNPAPMLPRLGELGAFRQFWFVSITPYGRETETGVPDKRQVIDALLELSGRVGPRAVSVRYDPIFVNGKYTVDFHLRAFERLMEKIGGAISSVVFSFVDLYGKTLRNFPGVDAVSEDDQRTLCRGMADTCAGYSLPLRACLEDSSLSRCGADVTGCMTKQVLEQAIGRNLAVPPDVKVARKGCECLLGSDIGAYNTCLHGCRYCYANASPKAVRQNFTNHDPLSPLLVGHVRPGDDVRQARQVSYLKEEGGLF